MQFSQIIGLSETKQHLIRSVQENHIAHALLFHGKEGSANLAMAVAFATYINCENKQADDSCGKCASCLKMSKLAHPDVSYIFPTAGGAKVISENFLSQWREFVAETPYSNVSEWLEKISIKQGNIPVEEARQLIQKLALKSYEGGYKIVLIWQAEMLHTATANALLKVLEEPPEQTLFLLVCNQIDKLLTTIVSRTQRVGIRNFTDDEVIAYLTEKQAISIDKAKQIAFFAEGSLHDALQTLGNAEADKHQWFANWMRMCYAFNIQKLVPLADEFDGMTKEAQKEMFVYSIQMLREIFLFVYSGENLVKLQQEELVFVQKFSKAININQLENMVQVLSEAHYHIERNVRAKMVFLDISLQMGRMMK